MRWLFLSFLLLAGLTAGAQDLSRAEVRGINERAYGLYAADFAMADSVFSRAVAAAGTGGWRAEEAHARKHLGVVRYLRGDYAAALPLYQEALSIFEELDDANGQAAVLVEMGNFFKKRKEIDRARSMLQRAERLATTGGDQRLLSNALDIQGEAWLGAKDTARAIPYLERSLQRSRAIGFTDLQQWTMNLLAEAYAATDKPAAALSLQRQVQTLKDSLYDAGTSQRIAELQEEYEAEKREAELALRSSQLATRTALLAAAGLGLVLLAGLLYYRNQHQRRQRAELRRQAQDRLRNDRLRISRDLHDHLGAELSIIASDLGRLDRQLPQQPLRGVTRQVREAMEQMRETIERFNLPPRPVPRSSSWRKA